MKTKPKILIVNKYHFISGGAERYFLSIMESLRRKGFESIPFSVNYSRTIATPYQKYFIEPVVTDGEAKIQNQKPSWGQQLELAVRAIYNARAAESIRRIHEDHKPEIAYFLNFNNHISPSAIDACVKLNIPVVMRMSDFNLVCASNMYYRDGHPCMDCKRGLYHAILNKCVHGSLTKSITSYAATQIHRWMGVYKKVSGFIAPTQFMKNELMELGFPESIIHQINTFAVPQKKIEPNLVHPYILFVGRFAPYKGIDTAIRAFRLIEDSVNAEFHLIGDENDRDANRVKALAAQLNAKKIRFFLFERDKNRLLGRVQRALFNLVPSENYENLPNAILESYSCGRPVIATRLGSIPDIVKDGEEGLLYELGDCNGLAQKIKMLVEDSLLREKMGAKAYETLNAQYSEDQHLRELIRVFELVKGSSFQLSPQEFGPPLRVA